MILIDHIHQQTCVSIKPSFSVVSLLLLLLVSVLQLQRRAACRIFSPL